MNPRILLALGVGLLGPLMLFWLTLGEPRSGSEVPSPATKSMESDSVSVPMSFPLAVPVSTNNAFDKDPPESRIEVAPELLESQEEEEPVHYPRQPHSVSWRVTDTQGVSLSIAESDLSGSFGIWGEIGEEQWEESMEFDGLPVELSLPLSEEYWLEEFELSDHVVWEYHVAEFDRLTSSLVIEIGIHPKLTVVGVDEFGANLEVIECIDGEDAWDYLSQPRTDSSTDYGHWREVGEVPLFLEEVPYSLGVTAPGYGLSLIPDVLERTSPIRVSLSPGGQVELTLVDVLGSATYVRVTQEGAADTPWEIYGRMEEGTSELLSPIPVGIYRADCLIEDSEGEELIIASSVFGVQEGITTKVVLTPQWPKELMGNPVKVGGTVTARDEEGHPDLELIPLDRIVFIDESTSLELESRRSTGEGWEWDWEMDSVLPGRYRAVVSTLYIDQEIEVPPWGDQDIRLVQPPMSELEFRITGLDSEDESIDVGLVRGDDWNRESVSHGKKMRVPFGEVRITSWDERVFFQDQKINVQTSSVIVELKAKTATQLKIVPIRTGEYAGISINDLDAELEPLTPGASWYIMVFEETFILASIQKPGRFLVKLLNEDGQVLARAEVLVVDGQENVVEVYY